MIFLNRTFKNYSSSFLFSMIVNSELLPERARSHKAPMQPAINNS